MKKKQDLKLINIINKVISSIKKHDMIHSNDKIVVGISGGPDSVCLLHILYNLRDLFSFKLIAAHFEHGLRPGEDERETEFVRSFVKDFGIPFEYKRANQDIKKGSGSLEEKARIARYEFLEEVRKKYGADRIALGHNMNDQAETVLMRFLRGSGITGLKGIPPVRDGIIIRPIIELSREEILYYLEKNRLYYMCDSSNTDISFLRNRLRYRLIPVLQQYQPNIIEVLSRTAEVIRIEDEFMELQAKEWVEKNVLFENGIIAVPISLLKKIHTALRNRVIRYMLKIKIGHLKRITYDHINDIIQLFDGKRPNMEIHLPYNIVVKKVYDWLIVDNKKKQPDFCYNIPDIGTYYLDAIDGWLTVEQVDSIDESERDKNTVFLNADLIEFPITIRNIRAGDKIALAGVKGHKKIKDIFIDMKIPQDIRKIIPILVNRDKPIYLWCINKIDKRYEANTKEGGNILKISLKIGKIPFWKHIYKEENHVAG